MNNEIVINGLLEFEKQLGFTTVDLLDQLSKHEGDTIYLKINSLGGYVEVADEMKDILLKSGKNIVSENTGNVASAAVVLFMLASQRYYYPERGIFLIHNSWVEGVKGNGDALEAIAEELKQIDDRYDKEIARITGKDIELIRQYSRLDTPLTPEQVTNLNIAQIKYEFKAVAKYKSNINNTEMTEIKQELESMEKSLFDKISGLFKNPKAKQLLVIDVNGVEIDFPGITDMAEIAEGVAVTAENGEYTLSDGTAVVVEGGKVASVTAPVVQDEEVMQLKEQIAELQSQIEQKESAMQEATQEVESAKQVATEVKKDFEAFKAKMTAYIPEPANTPEEEEKKSFKYKSK